MIPISDANPTSRPPFWTITFIVINIIVFWLELSGNSDAFIQQYALTSAFVNLNDWTTLLPFITSQFLHAGWLHIISNMLFLWVFGDNVEDRFGFFWYPIIYLLSGVVGGFAQYIMAPESTIPMLGASGAVAGILGAYLVYFPQHRIKTIIPIFGFFTITEIPATFMLIYWFITQLFAGVFSFTDASQGGVAYLAHIGGFATGWIFAKLFGSSSAVERLEYV